MAGEGRRFAEAGYTKPKPLIDVAGKPMIERVVDCLTPRTPHRVTLLSREMVGETRGAVDTLLHAVSRVDPRRPLLVANCDQYLSVSIDDFLEHAVGDAAIMTFNSTNPHHSYVKVADGLVSEIAEKRVISDDAVLGVYWFSSGQLAFDYARKVIANQAVHDDGEFYISSMLGLMIDDRLALTTYEVDVHDKHMLGTPEELQIFLDKVADGRVRL